MPSNKHTHGRRAFLKGLCGASVSAGVAGCVGDLDLTPGDGEGSWPPPRDIVENITPTNPGSTRDLVGRYWSDFMQEHYPDDVSTSVVATPGGEGIIAANDGYAADPDGGTILTLDFVPMLMNEIQREEAQYTTTDFESFAIVRQTTRGIQANPDTTGVDGHWEWDYETLLDEVIENDYTAGSATGTQYLFYEVLERVEPRLEEGDLDVVTFDGGDELRAAVEREEIDWYAGGFTSNYNREEFYYTQIAVADDRYPAVVEQIQENDEDAVFIDEAGMDEEAAVTLVDMMVDAIGLHLPPGTPEDLIEIHRETVEVTAEEEPELEETINDALGPGEFVAITGDEVQQQLEDKEEVMRENEDLLPEDFS